jgi:defect-in-organelle-trafficking protein DotB
MNAQGIIDFHDGILENVFARAMDALFIRGASDVTIQSSDYVWAYIDRRHQRVSTSRLDDSQVARLIQYLFGDASCIGQLGRGEPLDFDKDIRPYLDVDKDDYKPDHSLRCRVNVTACRVGSVANGSSITLRTIPGIPPALSYHKLQHDIVENLFPDKGLVLVVGVTGSGKSTLLASSVREMLSDARNPKKIITYEDPVEFVYGQLPSAPLEGEEPAQPGAVTARMPEVSQMQMRTHLREISMAAPNTLRRKTDVVVMGEMRDRETVAAGLLLSSTGHCAYATMHCDTPAESLARAISEFPVDEQPAAANKLLSDLRLVIAQKIKTDINGKARAFRSWVVFDMDLKSELFEHPFPKWTRMITQHMESKGQTFADQAYAVLERGEITKETFGEIAGFNTAETRRYLNAREFKTIGSTQVIAQTDRGEVAYAG